MKSNRQVLWGACVSLFPCYVEPSPPAGAYVAFFVFPVVVAWVAIYVGFAVRGDIYDASGLLSFRFQSRLFAIFGIRSDRCGAMGWGDSMLLPIIEGLVVGFIPVLIFSKRTDRKPDGAP
jgi:hypothetical protein